MKQGTWKSQIWHWLSTQGSSAKLECAFSKTELIVSKKRQRLIADHVNGTILMGWHYKDNGWGELEMIPRCGAEMEIDRH